jgi:hypothetical protein
MAQAHRVQITTDGHKMYLDAMEAGFGGQADHGADASLKKELAIFFDAVPPRAYHWAVEVASENPLSFHP